MSPAEVAAVARLRLAAELDQDREGLRSLASAILRLQHRTDDSDREWLRVRALSFEIERWYTAVEGLFERILRTLEGEVPEGASRHRELLRLAVVAVEPLRPALLPLSVQGDARELLGFRHLARHAYDVEPDPERMRAHADRVARVQVALCASMAALVVRLRS